MFKFAKNRQNGPKNTKTDQQNITNILHFVNTKSHLSRIVIGASTRIIDGSKL